MFYDSSENRIIRQLLEECCAVRQGNQTAT